MKLAGIIFLVALALGCGCTRRIMVPVEREVLLHDTVRLRAERVDSFLVRDSVVMKLEGDTVVHERWSWRDRIRLRSDTVYLSRRDTLVRRETLPVSDPAAGAKRKKGAAGKLLLTLLLGAALGAGCLICLRIALKRLENRCK